MIAIKRVFIYYKKDSESAAATSKRVLDWMSERGIDAFALEAGAKLPDEVWETNAAIVLGGDGTILGLSRKLAGTSVPIFGINFGKVGFLTVAASGEWKSASRKLINGEFEIFRYMALKWRVFREGVEIKSGVCANDLVLSRNYPAKLMTVGIAVNDEDLGAMRGDGLIVCAPLGSTGYCVSAGGPIIFSGLNSMGIVPICAFPLGAAPFVVPGEARLELKIIPSASECYCALDGQEVFRLENGDVVRITGWNNALAFYGSESLFFRHLRERGFVLESH